MPSPSRGVSTAPAWLRSWSGGPSGLTTTKVQRSARKRTFLSSETHEISLPDGFEVALKKRGKLEAGDGIRRRRNVNVVRLSPEELRGDITESVSRLSHVCVTAYRQ